MIPFSFSFGFERFYRFYPEGRPGVKGQSGRSVSGFRPTSCSMGHPRQSVSQTKGTVKIDDMPSARLDR